MNFKNTTSDNGGFITLQKNNEEAGKLTYTIIPQDQKMIISYVYISPKFRGKALGKYLVEEAIRYARTHNYKVFPHCSFAHSVMNLMDDIDDILIQ